MTIKIVYPENIDQAKVLMQFLVNEEQRHRNDLDAIKLDILELKLQWHIDIPLPNHTFMKVTK